MFPKLLFFFGVLALLEGCTVQATLTLTPGATDAQATFQLQPQTQKAWQSLRDLDPTLPLDPLDPTLLKKSLGSSGRVVWGSGKTTVSASIADLTRYLPTLKTSPEVWEATLDRTSVRQWANLTAWADSPALDSVLPSPATKVTEAEYRDLLAYLLGPGLTEAAANTLIEQSTVQLTLVAPRPIQSAPGSVSVNGNSAVYRWPLTRVLVLEPPIKIRLLF